MRRFLTILLLLLNYLVSAQSPQLKELWKLSRKHEWEELVEKGNQFLKKDTSNVEYNLMVGIALLRN